jgi:hypothetical protein
MMEDKFTYRLDFDTCDLYDTFKLFKDDALEEEYGLENLGLHPQEYYKTSESIKREFFSSITSSAKIINHYEIIQPLPCF